MPTIPITVLKQSPLSEDVVPAVIAAFQPGLSPQPLALAATWQVLGGDAANGFSVPIQDSVTLLVQAGGSIVHCAPQHVWASSTAAETRPLAALHRLHLGALKVPVVGQMALLSRTRRVACHVFPDCIIVSPETRTDWDLRRLNPAAAEAASPLAIWVPPAKSRREQAERFERVQAQIALHARLCRRQIDDMAREYNVRLSNISSSVIPLAA